MRTRSLVCIGLGALALAVAAAAQPASAASPAPIAVGAAAVDGAVLQPYDNVWRYTVRLADGTVKVQGLWTDHLERIEVDGRSVFRRVQGMTYVNGLSSANLNVFDPKTVAPISSLLHAPDG